MTVFQFSITVTKKMGTSRAKFYLDFICSLSNQDYKEIICDLDPDAPTLGNPESLRAMQESHFSSNVELD